MIDDRFTLTVERLRDDLGNLKAQLRKKYKSATRQVVADDIKALAARLAETWMVDVAPRQEVQELLPADTLGDLNVRFQRILTFSEHASKRSRYDKEISGILKRFTVDVIIPLKQARSGHAVIRTQVTPTTVKVSQDNNFSPSAFVGHSFATQDEYINQSVIDCLGGLGIAVETGSRPRAERISEKVKRLIEEPFIFVGIFTRRDKIARKPEWTTSPWVIDEKAYAVGVNKKLILLKESGVGSIGGIQGDYEYIEFSRDKIQILINRIIQVFSVSANGFRM